MHVVCRGAIAPLVTYVVRFPTALATCDLRRRRRRYGLRKRRVGLARAVIRCLERHVTPRVAFSPWRQVTGEMRRVKRRERRAEITPRDTHFYGKHAARVVSRGVLMRPRQVRSRHRAQSICSSALAREREIKKFFSGKPRDNIVLIARGQAARRGAAHTRARVCIRVCWLIEAGVGTSWRFPNARDDPLVREALDKGVPDD